MSKKLQRTKHYLHIILVSFGLIVLLVAAATMIQQTFGRPPAGNSSSAQH